MVGAIGSIGAAVRGFGAIMAGTLLQMALFVATTAAIENIVNGTTGFGEKNEVNELKKRIRGDESMLRDLKAREKNAIQDAPSAYKAIQIANAFTEQKEGLEAKIAANKAKLLDMQKAEMNEAVKSAEQLAEEQFLKIANSKLGGAIKGDPTISNKIGDKDNSSSSPSSPASPRIS